METIEQITPPQLDQWLARQHAAGAKPLLIDVREPWEWALASVAATQAFDLLPLPMGTIPAELNQLDPDRPTALLCHHGARSQSVAQFLLNNGFEQVANIAGGIDAWSAWDPRIPRY